MAVTVFLGWSGERSKALAEILHDWLPDVIQGVNPWFSKKINKGEAWFGVIGEKLGKADFGVFCLTPENIEEPWVFFEAGAMYGKAKKQANVCTLLLDMDHEDIPPPLSMFQATEITKEDMRALVGTLNDALKEPVLEKKLDKAFDSLWPELERKIENIPLPKNPKIDVVFVDEGGCHYFLPQTELFQDQILSNFLVGCVIPKFGPSLIAVTAGNSMDFGDYIKNLKLVDVVNECWFEAKLEDNVQKIIRKQRTDAVIVMHQEAAAKLDGMPKAHIFAAKFLLESQNQPRNRFKSKGFLDG